jgi:hypothetical protein
MTIEPSIVVPPPNELKFINPGFVAKRPELEPDYLHTYIHI